MNALKSVLRKFEDFTPFVRKKMNKTYKTLFFKIIALAVAPIFLYQQIVWAQGGASPQTAPMVNSHKSDITRRGNVTNHDIDLPYNLAHRDEVYTGAREERIIHLQDAHASLSAQYSLVNLLDVLATDYDLEFIALEGTEGVIDTSLLKSFPDKDIREKTADLLMREGRMSAGEFFQITRDENNIVLYGVEDNELYEENLNGFCRVIEQREPLVKMVKAFRGQIDELEEKVYSEELRSFVRKGRAHKNGTLSFSNYWREIAPLLERFGIETKNLRDVSILTESIELEGKIDFEKANTERTSLISELTGRLKKDELEALVLESVNFKEQKVSPASFHKYLGRLGGENDISLTGYKNFSMFTEYVSLYESVDIFNLYNEVEFVEKAVLDKLYRTDDERELYEISVMMELLRGLYSIELSSRDFGFFKEAREKYDAKKFAAFLRDICGKYSVSIGKGYDLSEMLGGINSAVNFYETAARRDRLMIQNTLKRMKNEKKRVAALITGGYHTKGLTEIMKEKKLSYLIISPKFEKDEERPYVAVLTGKKKPYQELIDAGKYQIMAPAWNNPLDDGRTRSLKDQEIALLFSCITELYEGGNWEKMVEEWKLDIDPAADIRGVLDNLVVRRIKGIVLAGVGNTPIVAIMDASGIPKRVEMNEELRKIWNKRAGVVVQGLEKIATKVKLTTELDTELNDDLVDRFLERYSKETSLMRMHDEKTLLKNIKRRLKAMGVSKESLESKESDKFIRVVISKIRQFDKKGKVTSTKPVEAFRDISGTKPESGVDPVVRNLPISREEAHKKESKVESKKKFYDVTASFTLVMFLCYLVLCHSPLPRAGGSGLPDADWASKAGIGMLLSEGVEAELTSIQKFVKNTGVVIELPQGARAIGTEDGIFTCPDETKALFENLTVPSVVVNLKIGSGDTSGVEYSDDGTPLGFKDIDLAIKDMIKLITIAADNNKKLTIFFHDDGIKDVLEDMNKSMAMAMNVDCKLINDMKTYVGNNLSDWDNWGNWNNVEYLGFLNSPDAIDADVRGSVEIGNNMLRAFGKPICVGSVDIENIENWMLPSTLKAGDRFSVRFSEDNLPELLAKLKNTIGAIEIPEGINIGYGELPESIDGESVVLEVLSGAYTGGALSAYFGNFNDMFASEKYEQTVEDALEDTDNEGETRYAESERLESITLEDEDDKGNVYYHFIDEDFADNLGRIDIIKKANATDDNELAFKNEYDDDAFMDKRGQYRYRYGYSDAECTTCVMKYEYDEDGRLKSKEDYVKGETYVNYPGTTLIESLTLNEPDADGYVYYHHIKEDQSRIDITKRKVANDKSEIAFEYEYHSAPHGDIHKTVKAYSAWDEDEKKGVNEVAVYEYDVDGDLVEEEEEKKQEEEEKKQQEEEKKRQEEEEKKKQEEEEKKRQEEEEKKKQEEEEKKRQEEEEKKKQEEEEKKRQEEEEKKKQEEEEKKKQEEEEKKRQEEEEKKKNEEEKKDEAKDEEADTEEIDDTHDADVNIDVDVTDDTNIGDADADVTEDVSDATNDVDDTVVADEDNSADLSGDDPSDTGCFINTADFDNKSEQINESHQNTPITKMPKRKGVENAIPTKTGNELKETEFKAVLGLSIRMYNDIVENGWGDKLLDITDGAEIILLKENSDREAVQKEFNKKTKGKKVIGAIIDQTAFKEIDNFDEFERIVTDFIKTAKKEIVPLMMTRSEDYNLTRSMRVAIKKDFGRIETLTKKKKEEWNKKIEVFVRTLPMESLRLIEKGIYDLPINEWHEAVIEKDRISSEAKVFAQAGGGVANRKYISVSAYDLADMRFIANTIRDLGIDKRTASKFIHVRLRNDNVPTRKKLKKYMKTTGLDGYLYLKNVDIISEQEEKDMTLEKILGKVKARFSNQASSMGFVNNDQIFVGNTKELNFSENDKAILSADEKAPKFIQMKGPGIVSQLLLTLVEFSAVGEIPTSLGEITLDLNYPGLKIYIYIPKIEKADYEAIRDVIRNFEIMQSSA